MQMKKQMKLQVNETLNLNFAAATTFSEASNSHRHSPSRVEASLFHVQLHF